MSKDLVGGVKAREGQPYLLPKWLVPLTHTPLLEQPQRHRFLSQPRGYLDPQNDPQAHLCVYTHKHLHCNVGLQSLPIHSTLGMHTHTAQIWA